jgi:hypothetical protein
MDQQINRGWRWRCVSSPEELLEFYRWTRPTSWPHLVGNLNATYGDLVKHFGPALNPHLSSKHQIEAEWNIEAFSAANDADQVKFYIYNTVPLEGWLCGDLPPVQSVRYWCLGEIVDDLQLIRQALASWGFSVIPGAWPDDGWEDIPDGDIV